MLGLVGQSDKAISMAKAALELEPLSVSANIDLGIIYIYTRHPDEAIEQLRKAIDLEPANKTVPNFLLFAYEQKGMYDEFMEEYLRSAANPEEVETIRKIYAASGFKGFCQYLLDKVLKRAEGGNVSPFTLACRYANVGDNDKAMEWLEKSYQAHERMMTNIKVDVRLDRLRSDRRFKEMIRRVGLPE
jgi:tetratricopeptide (TPR) repeat protein